MNRQKGLEIQLKTKGKYISSIKDESRKSWFIDDTMKSVRETASSYEGIHGQYMGIWHSGEDNL